METQKLFWEIEDFTANEFKLFSEGKKIYSQKLTIKQVEEKIGRKIKVCPAYENPDFIVGAFAEEDGKLYTDGRKSLRGALRRYYVLA